MYFADIKLKVKVRAGSFENWKFQLLEKIAKSNNLNCPRIKKYILNPMYYTILQVVSQAAELS